MHTPHSPTAPDGDAMRRAAGWQHALDATTSGRGRADGASAAAESSGCCSSTLEREVPFRVLRAQMRGAHTQLRIARACHRP
eukprot:4929214-Prymnesium_polylepis.1